MVSKTWNPADNHLAAHRGPARSLFAGVAAALVGATLWVVLAGLAGATIGVAAVGIGYLVGRAMAATAGTSRRLPVIAALLSLIGCLLGGLLIETHAMAESIGLGTVDLIGLMLTRSELVREIGTADLGLIDAAFWVVSAALGYRLTARAVKRMNILADISPARPVARPSGLDFNDPTSPPPPALPVAGQHPSKFFGRTTGAPTPQPARRPLIPAQYSPASAPTPVGAGAPVRAGTPVKRPARGYDARTPRAF
jgi:hypothetical protein